MTRGKAEEPEMIVQWSAPAGPKASSYQAEAVALCEAVEWLGRTETAWQHCRIATDSLSCVQALAGGMTPKLDALMHRFWCATRRIAADKVVTVTWIPGHCGVIGNEAADRL